MPKAAMVTHGNFVAAITGLNSICPGTLSPSDVLVAFLPLAHSLERAALCSKIYYGCASAFFNGDYLKLKDDITLAKPTMMVAVPRLLNRLADGIKAKFDAVPPGMKKNLIQKAVSKKLKTLQETGKYTSSVWDRLVFNKVKEGFGGNLRNIGTGGAPVSKEVFEFLKIAACCPINQGYGLTETCAPAFTTHPEDNELTVGGVLSPNEFKLVDIPEMSYTSKDNIDGVLTPRGEIWIRGYSVFAGYFNQPDKTEEMLTEDGWLKTGDVGSITPNGALKIIDRKKNIFKLAQGEYIAPEKLEAVYGKARGVAELFVYGDSFHGHLVAIIVPNDPVLLQMAQELQVEGDINAVCNQKKVKDAILKELNRLAVENKLNGLERIKSVHLDPCTTFMNRGILTTSMKLKRHDAKNLYQKAIDEMYAEHP